MDNVSLKKRCFLFGQKYISKWSLGPLWLQEECLESPNSLFRQSGQSAVVCYLYFCRHFTRKINTRSSGSHRPLLSFGALNFVCIYETLPTKANFHNLATSWDGSCADLIMVMMDTESEPLSHPLRTAYSIFLSLTTWASPSQSKHSDACGWASDCQTSGPAGLRVTRALEGTFRGRMCMWCGKPRALESTLRSGPNTHRGQLPSIKPETPASAVPYAPNQPALICTSQGKRYRAWKITGKKIIIVSKGAL